MPCLPSLHRNSQKSSLQHFLATCLCLTITKLFVFWLSITSALYAVMISTFAGMTKESTNENILVWFILRALLPSYSQEEKPSVDDAFHVLAAKWWYGVPSVPYRSTSKLLDDIYATSDGFIGVFGIIIATITAFAYYIYLSLRNDKKKKKTSVMVAIGSVHRSSSPGAGGEWL